MASTDKMLAILGARKMNGEEMLYNEIIDSSDEPQLNPSLSADMSKELAQILSSSMTKQYTPMD